jgi:hypothetical protein
LPSRRFRRCFVGEAAPRRRRRHAAAGGISGCQTATVVGSPEVGWSEGRYVVTSVTVSGLDDRCAGHTVSAALTGANGRRRLLTLAGVVPPRGGTLHLRARPVAVADVSGVSVAIRG